MLFSSTIKRREVGGMLDKRRKGAGKGRGENYSLTSHLSPLTSKS